MQAGWTSAEHEAGLALFVDPQYRRRFKAVLAMGARKRQNTLPGYLCHFSHALDGRFARQLAPSGQWAERALAILQSWGAPALCYVVSGSTELDGKTMSLEEALVGVEHGLAQGGYGEGVMISCVPGKLGSYHDHEDWNCQYTLVRSDG